MTKPTIEERLAILERRQELLFQFAGKGSRANLVHHWKSADKKTAGVLTASAAKQNEQAASMRKAETQARTVTDKEIAKQTAERIASKEERVAEALEGHTWIGHGQYRDRDGIVREVGYDPAEEAAALEQWPLKEA